MYIVYATNVIYKCGREVPLSLQLGGVNGLVVGKIGGVRGQVWSNYPSKNTRIGDVATLELVAGVTGSVWVLKANNAVSQKNGWRNRANTECFCEDLSRFE